MYKLTCLQIHNDYQIPGGETKTVESIANLLEEYGVRVIRYYKSNKQFVGGGVCKKVFVGVHSIYNKVSEREINQILDDCKIDFALIHNVMPIISNSVYKVLVKRHIPIIKYIQNYNLICLNGAINQGSACESCKKHLWIGVKRKCYKNNVIYSAVRYIVKENFDRNYLKHISAFMANSMFVKQTHVRYGLEASKIHVMYNYILNTNIEKIVDCYNSYYLYFGRISKEKGIFTVLSAFAEMNEVRLKIMGSGEQEEQVLEYIQGHALENVDYVGACSGEKLNSIIRNAKCVLVPSEWEEPLPRTILESYAEGIPVIGSDCGGIPEMIRIKETGMIFASGSVSELQKRVLYIEALDRSEYEKMRKNCSEEVAEKYTKEKYYERFMECVKEIGVYE